MSDSERCAEVARLVAQAQRDLSHVQDLIAEEGDCVVATVLLARAARNTDDAVFVLLDAHAAGGREDPWNIPLWGMIDSVPREGSFQ
jgi:uncharacterized protein (DUF2336 family)